MIADEELFREWQSGSAGALETLVRRYHAPLVAHLYRVLGDAHLAEDLAQETCIRLVRDAHAYHYPRPFRPWLYTIAHHLALNYRASAYSRHVENRVELPETRDADPDPAEWFERWEQHSHLQKAIARLSLEQREVLTSFSYNYHPANDPATQLALKAEGWLTGGPIHAPSPALAQQVVHLVQQNMPPSWLPLSFLWNRLFFLGLSVVLVGATMYIVGRQRRGAF